MCHSLHLAFLVHLVCLVHRAGLLQPTKPDEPDSLCRIISAINIQVNVSANRLLKPLHKVPVPICQGWGLTHRSYNSVAVVGVTTW
jgi:hypothetical protein